jgi:Asp-tRNA(Asn)/Glu-tRNA(Gln) amidotransferase A subunit family amidase
MSWRVHARTRKLSGEMGARMNDFHRLSATECVEEIRSSRLSSVDLVNDCLRRIAIREPVIGAWAHLDAEFARAQARAADAAKAAGKPLGPLHGVPVGIKDIIDTQDLATEHGTPAFAGRRPSHDAEVVRRLKSAGAIILGKTVTTELAFYGPGKTRNPADPNRTPGGSSSGSAAAVADFHVPLALGSQTAGSILRPASYCGVMGFKPTFGLIPLDGVIEQSPPLDTLGGYARSAADLALLTAVLSGTPCALPDLSARPLRLVFIKTPAWPQGDQVMRDSLERLALANTDVVDEMGMPASFDDTGGLQRAVQFHDIAKNYGPIVDKHAAVMSPKLKEVIAEGRTVSDAEYEAARARREPLTQSLDHIFAEYDAILTPAAQGVAPQGLSATGSPMFNFIWTYLGLPAISIPLLTVGGLPLGVQLVAPRGADARLLAVADRAMRSLKPN